MLITVTARSGEISDGMKEYAEKKIKKLERVLPNIQSVQITEQKERAWYIVEITVQAGNILVRSQDRADDMRTAVDSVVDKLERQIKKYRQKLSDRYQRLAPEVPQEVATVARGEAEQAREESEEVSLEAAGRIIRNKRFDMKPMGADEAAAEMELLGHDFYVFANADSGAVNVIYRRRDGNYGLIEPEF